MNSEKVKEIKKALKYHISQDTINGYFDRLQYEEKWQSKSVSFSNILALINELESENKKLKQHNAGLEKYIEGNEQDAKAFVNGWHKDLETELKQFAEKLKEKAYPFPCAIGTEYAIPHCKVDETLKECLCEKQV